MKNEEIKIGIKEIQKIKMTANEKENILKSVLNFSIPEKKPIYSPYSFVSIFQRNHFVFYGALAIFVVFLGSGGLFLGSQKSLPGNALYPIKTGLVEPLSSALKLSSEKKAQYEISLVKERVQETKILASRGELDRAKEEQVKELIETHKDAFSKAIEEIKQEEPTQEIVATAVNLEQQMEENVQTLAMAVQEVTEENTGNQTGEIIAMAKPTPELVKNETIEIDSPSVSSSENTEEVLENKEVAQVFGSSNQKPYDSMPKGGAIMMPMSTSNENDLQKYVDISLPLFTDWIKERSLEQNNLLDYRINDINFIASKQLNEKESVYFRNKDSVYAFTVSVNYSVQTTNEGKNSNTFIGNGIDGTDGWVLNKIILITIDKNEETGKYYIKRMGSGF